MMMVRKDREEDSVRMKGRRREEGCESLETGKEGATGEERKGRER